MTGMAVARIRRKVLKLAKFRRLRSGDNQSGFTPNLAGDFKKRYIYHVYRTFTDVPEIRWEVDSLFYNFKTKHVITKSVYMGNEQDNTNMCAKFQLIRQRLTPDPIDLLFRSMLLCAL